MKIYSENGTWYVEELSEIYYFKSISTTDNTEHQLLLTWTRMIDLSVYKNDPVRMYDIEHDGKKYFFLLFQYGDRYKLEPVNTYEIDQLCEIKNVKLIGEIK